MNNKNTLSVMTMQVTGRKFGSSEQSNYVTVKMKQRLYGTIHFHLLQDLTEK